VAEPLRALRFGRVVCGDLAQAERREWLLTNGLSGYASGTVAGSLTRRYHGLLIAPVGGPLERRLILAKADATLLLDEHAWPLFTNRWQDGVVAPAGHVNLESFLLDGRMPVWRFTFGDVGLEMRIWMEHGAHTTYVAYRLQGDRAARLRIALLANARGYHFSQSSFGTFNPQVVANGNRLDVTAPGLYQLHIQASDGRIEPSKIWHEHFQLMQEQERGLNDLDNHLCAGRAELELRPGKWTGLVASIAAGTDPQIDAAMERFHRRERQLVAGAEDCHPEFRNAPAWIRQLVLAADSFVIARPLPQAPDGESVIAGYPWFGDWGRDTMIALPGLTLATGRYASARKILDTFAALVDQGLLPNRFVNGGEQPEYNSVDAALWFIEVWRAYVQASGDREALEPVFPVLEGIIDWHVRGTRHCIRMDTDDKLLFAGEAGIQLTWMDAKVGDWVVTPRVGKPVEINALWYNALRTLAGFAADLGRDAGRYQSLADQVKESFRHFSRPAGGGLFDVLDGPDGDDASIRPNQIFALSLPHSPLEPETQQRVLTECGRELLTSYGLRSLSPNDPNYHNHYRGGVAERDGAYHQGTVWSWLLGHYALAEYRVHGDAAQAQRRLQPLEDHLTDAAVGSVNEIFDGDPPHAPRGAIAQAWSVACTLEAWLRLEKEKLKP